MKKLMKFLFKKSTMLFALALSVILSFGTWAMLGCGGNNFNDNPDVENITKQENTLLAVPKDGSTPADHTPNNNAYYSFSAISAQKNFVCNSQGNALTKVGFVNVSQAVKASRVINGNEVYKESLSHSSFKGVGIRAYVNGDNYIIRDANGVSSVNNVSWKNSARKISKSSYMQQFGYVPNGVTAYVMTDETILSSEYLGEENGIYSFSYNLDTIKATGKISLEMRTMAGTASLPIFEKVNLTIRMDKDWRVVETVTDCVYKVDMLGGVTCEEKITETFSSYNENLPVPDGDFFRSYIDAEVTEPLPVEPTALDYLMNGFSDYITGTKPLKVNLVANADMFGTPLSANGSVQLDINTNDPSPISARATINDISYGDINLSNAFIAYENDTAYLQLDKLKACGTVDEIMAMVSRILNLANTELPDLSATFSNLDVNSLLANATLTREEGNATVTLPISFGDLSLVATINFSDGDTIAFTGATASIAGVNLVITPNEQIEVPEIQTGYNKISTLLDILDNNNNIKFNLKVGSDISALVNFNPKTLSADIILGDVVAKYKDNNIYLNYNDLKVKLAINDIDTVVNKLSPLLDGKLEIPDFNKLLEGIDVMSLIDGAISSLTMVESENKLTLSTVIDAIPVDIRLDIVDGCYSIGGIYLTAQNTNVEITPYKDSINTILDEDLDNYNDILPLLDLIDDYNNVSLAIKIQQTELYFTLNLKTLTAFASVDGLEAFIDFNTGDIYARYPGVKAKVNLNDAQPILNVIEPLIVKFAGNNPLENLDFSCLRNLSIQDVLSSISVTEENEKLYLSVEVNDIKATAKFNTEDKSLIFESADISAFGTTLSAKKSEALNLEFDLTEDYIDLKDLVDTLGEKVCSVLLSNQLSVSASGSITSGNTVITIKDCAIQITDILGAPKANATLVIDIATTADDGTVTVSTHSIRLVYLDPSLVEEGAINVYFTYDNSADENVLEGTFTTTKASETLDILKRIYSLMPELQNALSPIIIPDTNGNPTLPNLNVDLLSLINSIQFSDDTLSADLNGKAFLCSLPSSMQALIQASKDGLILSVPSLKVDCLSLNLALNINKPAENEITDQLFTYQLSGNESDFSSINELLKVLSKTAESRSFDINANIGLSIGDWNIAKDTLHLRAQLDVIEKKTYAVITLTRKAFSVLGMSVWKDYDGTSTLYLDPENQMIYTKVEYRTRKLVWFQYQYTNHVEYAKYTVEEFTSDLLNNILKLVRLSNTIESLITNSNNNSNTSSTSTATIENTLLKYAYNGNDTFALSLDLEPLLKDVQKVDVKITHDSDFNVNSLTATVGLVNVITLNLDATLTSPFNVYQQTKETIASEVASGNYN